LSVALRKTGGKEYEGMPEIKVEGYDISLSIKDY